MTQSTCHENISSNISKYFSVTNIFHQKTGADIFSSVVESGSTGAVYWFSFEYISPFYGCCINKNNGPGLEVVLCWNKALIPY